MRDFLDKLFLKFIGDNDINYIGIKF